jgi:hyperosmotically inducible periplasmic protein
MNRFKSSVLIIGLPLIASGAFFAVGSAYAEPAAQSADSSVVTPGDKVVAPDNSGTNTRDKNGENVTAMDQSNRPEDLNLTREIRRAIMNDSSLSMEAKNIKIITLNGSVTLRGPVKTEQEKDAIMTKATQIARDTKINNELEIASGN